ncbi:MAG TPA: pyrroline-5-carboxylate reductase [Acidimicrobiales bacterium]|nr:pyrroline-5-carboxylate reductase [Acidimicrobiales bacterium]
MSPRLLIVGGGRMGTALARGLLRAGWEPQSLAVAEVDPGRRTELAEILPGVLLFGEPQRADGAVVAVKPLSAEAACRVLAGLDVPRWLSIVAGLPLERLESWAGPEVGVVRAMPNTPALVGEAMTAMAGGSRCTETDLDWAQSILCAVGRVVRVPEKALDAVTAVSGSGPAYVFLLAEALAAAGRDAGLSEVLAGELAVQTLVGAGRLLAEPGADPEVLRAQVTSPGGTTEAAVRVLESGGLRSLLSEAVQAAAERSRQLAAGAP